MMKVDRENTSINIVDNKTKKISNYQLTPLRHLIDSIKSTYHCDTIEFTYTLLQRKEFRFIQENVMYYKKDLLSIIGGSSSQYLEKEISICALEKMCIKEYTEVLEVIYEYYQNRVIDESLLKCSLSPENSAELYSNTDFPKLDTLLTLMKNDKSLSSTTNSILKGITNKSYLKSLLCQEDMYHHKLWRCND